MENDSSKIVVLYEILLLFSLQYSIIEALYIVPTILPIANSSQRTSFFIRFSHIFRGYSSKALLTHYFGTNVSALLFFSIRNGRSPEISLFNFPLYIWYNFLILPFFGSFTFPCLYFKNVSYFSLKKKKIN